VKIALQDSWPNIPCSAEAEWIRRALVVCARLGFEAYPVVTSDDIERLQPDCVIVTNECSPKLTPYPTLGLLWSPCIFYAPEPPRRRSILSYDGYLCGSDNIIEWLEAFLAGHRKPPLIMDGLFLPSSPDCGPAADLPSELALIYAGLHWDGNRHESIFRGLSQSVPMNVYGPPHKWQHVGESYRGPLPFDGRSVIEAIRASGIALCLHKPEHRAYNCPSMRLFEAAAAGALIISDDFTFPRYWFRDSILYVDSELPPSLVVKQIKEHVEWASNNREAANRKARSSNGLFRRSLSLDRMLEPLPEFVDHVRRRCCMVIPDHPCSGPTVEYILPIGSMPIGYLSRSLEGLASQTHRAIGVTLVQYRPLDQIEDEISNYRGRFRWLRRCIVRNNGKGSTAWWAGLACIKADFFGVLGEGDVLHPNHVAMVLAHFERYPECGLVYSGTVRVEEEGHYIDAFNFQGPAGKMIEETRELRVVEPPNLLGLTDLEKQMPLTGWLCRSSVLNSEILVDPELEFGEDVYFHALVSGRTTVGYTGSPTCVWMSRSISKTSCAVPGEAAAMADVIVRMRERLGVFLKDN
jgi:hypothetical protein